MLGLLSATVPKLGEIVTADMMNGLLEQITSVVPVTIPAVIGFAGIVKGISFLKGMVKGA